MKRVLKILSISIMTSTLIINAMSSTKVYSATENFKIDIGEAYGDENKSVEIPVYIKDISDTEISAMNFSLEYDDNLTLVSVKPGELINEASDLNYSNRENKINILFSDSEVGDGIIKGTGVLCFLNFNINPYASKNSFYIKKAVNDNEIFVDNNLKKISADIISGKIEKKDNVYKVQSNKIWQITFSQEIDYLNITSSNIVVKDIDGNVVNNKYRITNQGKTLEILPPSEGYTPNNSYTLTINDSFTSRKGRSLSKTVNVNFYIQR